MPEGREQGEQVGEDLVLQVSGVPVRRLPGLGANLGLAALGLFDDFAG